MATLVLCLDGTNQIKTQTRPTNVARMFDALGGTVTDAGDGSFETAVVGDAPVLGKYLPGVGTQGDPLLRLLGDVFGDGIAEPIIRGYTFLSRNHDAGDDIFIAGFSRGATAARALAGMVVGHGLLDRQTYDPADKNAAYRRAVAAWYDYRAARPDLADPTRLDLIATSLGQPLPVLGPGDLTPPPLVKAIGVFDTVSSLGLPSLNSNGVAVFDFSICDTSLNDNVLNGFHALAADETRDLFAPTFWAPRDGVVQQAFPGAHSDVGGGNPNRGLSDAVLDWMLGQMGAMGLPYDAGNLDPPLTPDPLGTAQDDAITFPFLLTPRRPRAFPLSAIASDSIKARWDQQTDVLPSNAPTPYRATGVYADDAPLFQP